MSQPPDMRYEDLFHKPLLTDADLVRIGKKESSTSEKLSIYAKTIGNSKAEDQAFAELGKRFVEKINESKITAIAQKLGIEPNAFKSEFNIDASNINERIHLLTINLPNAFELLQKINSQLKDLKFTQDRKLNSDETTEIISLYEKIKDKKDINVLNLSLMMKFGDEKVTVKWVNKHADEIISRYEKLEKLDQKTLTYLTDLFKHPGNDDEKTRALELLNSKNPSLIKESLKRADQQETHKTTWKTLLEKAVGDIPGKEIFIEQLMPLCQGAPNVETIKTFKATLALLTDKGYPPEAIATGCRDYFVAQQKRNQPFSPPQNEEALLHYCLPYLKPMDNWQSLLVASFHENSQEKKLAEHLKTATLNSTLKGPINEQELQALQHIISTGARLINEHNYPVEAIGKGCLEYLEQQRKDNLLLKPSLQSTELMPFCYKHLSAIDGWQKQLLLNKTDPFIELFVKQIDNSQFLGPVNRHELTALRELAAVGKALVQEYKYPPEAIAIGLRRLLQQARDENRPLQRSNNRQELLPFCFEGLVEMSATKSQKPTAQLVSLFNQINKPATALNESGQERLQQLVLTVSQPNFAEGKSLDHPGVRLKFISIVEDLGCSDIRSLNFHEYSPKLLAEAFDEHQKFMFELMDPEAIVQSVEKDPINTGTKLISSVLNGIMYDAPQEKKNSIQNSLAKIAGAIDKSGSNKALGNQINKQIASIGSKGKQVADVELHDFLDIGLVEFDVEISTAGLIESASEDIAKMKANPNKLEETDSYGLFGNLLVSLVHSIAKAQKSRTSLPLEEQPALADLLSNINTIIKAITPARGMLKFLKFIKVLNPIIEKGLNIFLDKQNKILTKKIAALEQNTTTLTFEEQKKLSVMKEQQKLILALKEVSGEIVNVISPVLMTLIERHRISEHKELLGYLKSLSNIPKKDVNPEKAISSLLTSSGVSSKEAQYCSSIVKNGIAIPQPRLEKPSVTMTDEQKEKWQADFTQAVSKKYPTSKTSRELLAEPLARELANSFLIEPNNSQQLDEMVKLVAIGASILREHGDVYTPEEVAIGCRRFLEQQQADGKPLKSPSWKVLTLINEKDRKQLLPFCFEAIVESQVPKDQQADVVNLFKQMGGQDVLLTKEGKDRLQKLALTVITPEFADNKPLAAPEVTSQFATALASVKCLHVDSLNKQAKDQDLRKRFLDNANALIKNGFTSFFDEKIKKDAETVQQLEKNKAATPQEEKELEKKISQLEESKYLAAAFKRLPQEMLAQMAPVFMVLIEKGKISECDDLLNQLRPPGEINEEVLLNHLLTSCEVILKDSKQYSGIVEDLFSTLRGLSKKPKEPQSAISPVHRQEPVPAPIQTELNATQKTNQEIWKKNFIQAVNAQYSDNTSRVLGALLADELAASFFVGTFNQNQMKEMVNLIGVAVSITKNHPGTYDISEMARGCRRYFESQKADNQSLSSPYWGFEWAINDSNRNALLPFCLENTTEPQPNQVVWKNNFIKAANAQSKDLANLLTTELADSFFTGPYNAKEMQEMLKLMELGISVMNSNPGVYEPTEVAIGIRRYLEKQKDDGEPISSPSWTFSIDENDRKQLLPFCFEGIVENQIRNELMNPAIRQEKDLQPRVMNLFKKIEGTDKPLTKDGKDNVLWLASQVMAPEFASGKSLIFPAVTSRFHLVLESINGSSVTQLNGHIDQERFIQNGNAIFGKINMGKVREAVSENVADCAKAVIAPIVDVFMAGTAAEEIRQTKTQVSDLIDGLAQEESAQAAANLIKTSLSQFKMLRAANVDINISAQRATGIVKQQVSNLQQGLATEKRLPTEEEAAAQNIIGKPILYVVRSITSAQNQINEGKTELSPLAKILPKLCSKIGLLKMGLSALPLLASAIPFFQNLIVSGVNAAVDNAIEKKQASLEKLRNESFGDPEEFKEAQLKIKELEQSIALLSYVRKNSEKLVEVGVKIIVPLLKRHDLNKHSGLLDYLGKLQDPKARVDPQELMGHLLNSTTIALNEIDEPYKDLIPGLIDALRFIQTIPPKSMPTE